MSTPQWIWTVATALRGIMDWKLRHIRPHGNFMLSDVFNGGVPFRDPLFFVFIHYDCLNQWMMNHQSSILYHFPLDCYCVSYCKGALRHPWLLLSIIINHVFWFCVPKRDCNLVRTNVGNHDAGEGSAFHRPLWCPCVFHPLWINHQWMMNHRLSILYHFPLIANVSIAALSY